MYVYLSRVRARSPEADQESCRNFSHLLQMHLEAGFVDGACTINVTDPCDIFAYTRWANRQSAQHWKNAEASRHIEEVTRKLRADGPLQIEVFEVWGE